jgi:hypothetical protein
MGERPNRKTGVEAEPKDRCSLTRHDNITKGSRIDHRFIKTIISLFAMLATNDRENKSFRLFAGAFGDEPSVVSRAG